MRIIVILLAILIMFGGVLGLIAGLAPGAIQLGTADDHKSFLSILPLVLASLSALASGLVLFALAGLLNNTDGIKTQQRFTEMMLEKMNRRGGAD